MPRTNRETIVMSLDYLEQSGCALASLYNLQCSSPVGINNIIEPELVATWEWKRIWIL